MWPSFRITLYALHVESGVRTYFLAMFFGVLKTSPFFYHVLSFEHKTQLTHTHRAL